MLYLKKISAILKLSALLIVFVVLIYRNVTISKVAELDEISDFVINNGYNAAKILEMLDGVYHENLTEKWGKPDGKLSDTRGDIWNIGNNKQIIVYYSGDGYVKNVRIDDVKADTDEI